jgi:hypothetical protein
MVENVKAKTVIIINCVIWIYLLKSTYIPSVDGNDQIVFNFLTLGFVIKLIPK